MINGGATSMAPRDWANLPIEILQIIASKFSCQFHFIRFRAVCHCWRLVVSPSFPPIITTNMAEFSPFSICSLQSPQQTRSFLVKLSQTSTGDSIFLNPFSPYRSSYSSGRGKKTLDLLDCPLVELYQGYNIIKLKYCLHMSEVKELVDEDFGVLVTKCNDRNLKIPQVTCESWSNLGDGFDQYHHDKGWIGLGSDKTQYDDIIVYQGKFFAIDSLGNVSWVDDKSIKLVQYFPPLYGRGERKHLLESDGHLYVVDSYFDLGRWRKSEWQDTEIDRVDRNCARVDMKVYKFDEERAKWVHVETMGDRVFVLGKQHSFSFSTSHVPGTEGDCIYFMERTSKDYEDHTKEEVLWVFRMDDRSIRLVSNLPDRERLFSPSMNRCFSSEAQPQTSVKHLDL